MIPSLAIFEMLADSTIRLTPPMLLRPVEEGILSLSDISRITPRACILVDNTRIAQERDSIFIGCIKGYLCCTEAYGELYLLFFLKESEQPIFAAFDDVLSFFSITV